MADLGGLFQTALAVIAIATLAGLGLMRGTVTNLRESLRDARDEIADKDRRLTAAETELARQSAKAESEVARLHAKIMSQAEGIDALGQQIRGDTALALLTEQLEVHHTEAKKHWAEDEKLLRQVHADIERLIGKSGP